MGIRVGMFQPIDEVSRASRLSVALLTKLVAAGMVEMRIAPSGHVSLSVEDVRAVILEAHGKKGRR